MRSISSFLGRSTGAAVILPRLIACATLDLLSRTVDVVEDMPSAPRKTRGDFHDCALLLNKSLKAGSCRRTTVIARRRMGLGIRWPGVPGTTNGKNGLYSTGEVEDGGGKPFLGFLHRRKQKTRTPDDAFVATASPFRQTQFHWGIPICGWLHHSGHRAPNCYWLDRCRSGTVYHLFPGHLDRRMALRCRRGSRGLDGDPHYRLVGVHSSLLRVRGAYAPSAAEFVALCHCMWRDDLVCGRLPSCSRCAAR